MNTRFRPRVSGSTYRSRTQSCPGPPGFDALRIRSGTRSSVNPSGAADAGGASGRRSRANRNVNCVSVNVVNSSKPMNWNVGPR